MLTNVILGVPGVVPVWLAWYFMSSWPLAALGLTQREPTENDGWVVTLVFVLPGVVLGVLVWYLIGRAVAHFGRLDGRGWFWPLSAVAALVPTIVLFLISAVR